MYFTIYKYLQNFKYSKNIYFIKASFLKHNFPYIFIYDAYLTFISISNGSYQIYGLNIFMITIHFITTAKEINVQAVVYLYI